MAGIAVSALADCLGATDCVGLDTGGRGGGGGGGGAGAGLARGVLVWDEDGMDTGLKPPCASTELLGVCGCCRVTACTKPVPPATIG